MVYDPKNKTFYDVNHPFNGYVNGMASNIFGRPKSEGYKFDMKDDKQVAKFWDFGGGRGDLLMAPVVVPNPDAARAFFETQVGKTFDYNLAWNNCRSYVCDGLSVGGVTIPTTAPIPYIWSTPFTMHWNKNMKSMEAYQDKNIKPTIPEIDDSPLLRKFNW